MVKKEPFRVTSSHLLNILNNHLFRERLAECDYNRGNNEKGFRVLQNTYGPRFKVTRLNEGNEGTLIDDPHIDSSLKTYPIIDVHSHPDYVAIVPSVGEITSFGDARGDLMSLNLLKEYNFNDEFKLITNPIIGILGIPRDILPLLLIQERRPTNFKEIKSLDNSFEQTFNSTEEVVDLINTSTPWRALYLKVPLDPKESLGEDYRSKLDEFEFTPKLKKRNQ